MAYPILIRKDVYKRQPVIYEPEFDPALRFFKDEPYTISQATDGAFEIEGPKIEKMLGYTTVSYTHLGIR